MIRFFSFFLILTFFSTQNGIAQEQDLLGSTSSDEIRESHRVFDIYVNRYNPDSTAVDYLRNFGESIEIKILFGTWCHDSKREVPAFIKTMELAENSNFKIEYIAVSREKSDPQGLSEAYDLQYTPTFIIFSAENEIGRIVEESTESIEQDLVQILKSGDFKDN
jgi:thiol-disulfide isomerase/thioredoxin